MMSMHCVFAAAVSLASSTNYYTTSTFRRDLRYDTCKCNKSVTLTGSGTSAGHRLAYS